MTIADNAKQAYYNTKAKAQELMNRETEDQYLFQYEKGQSLKRASTPRDEEEAASLGYFEAETGLTGGMLKSIELDINWLCGLGEDYSLSHAVDLFFRSTGSRKAKRLEGTLGTVRDVKPDVNMGQSVYRGAPTGYGYEDQANKLKGEPQY